MEETLLPATPGNHFPFFARQIVHDTLSDAYYRILYLPTDKAGRDTDETEEASATDAADASDTADTALSAGTAKKAYWIRVDSKTNVPASFSIDDTILKWRTHRYEGVLDTFGYSAPPDQEISAASMKTRDKHYQLIESMVKTVPDVYVPEKRAAMVRAAAAQYGVQVCSLYDYMGRYWRGGMTRDALTPHFSNIGRGRPDQFVPRKRLGRKKQSGENGKILDQKDLENFQKAITDFYSNDRKANLTEVYALMLAHYYVRPRFKGDTNPEQLPPDQKPSYMQFYYWHRKNQNLLEELKARKGEGKYQLENRGATGETETFVPGPGICAQIDATIADYYLVQSNDRNALVGRPVIYFVKDVKTRMITGMYVTLENCSWESALMALKNTCEDKVEYCRRYGIEIQPEEWPCRCFPATITGDNGEMADHGVEEIISRLGVTIENTPPYRGDLKAIVEKTFDMINLKLHYIVPGHVEKDDGQRGAVNRRKEACLDLNTFIQLLIRCVLFYNNHWYMEDYTRTPGMREHGIRPIPRELWNYGIQYESGALRSLNLLDIYRFLLPKEKAVVTEKGIQFRSLYYTCDLAEKESWFDKARSTGRWKLSISYDPSCLDHIYIQRENDLIPCSLLAKSSNYSGATEDDMKRYRETDRQEKAEYAQDLERARTNLILEIETAVKRCRKEKDHCDTDTGGTLNGRKVRENRSKEKTVLSGEAEAYEKQSHMLAGTESEPENETSDQKGASVDDAINRAIDAALANAGLI